MFMGEYQHSIDGKGRIIVPSRFREELGESFIATKGLEHCLFLYPQSEWSLLEQRMHDMPLNKAETRAFLRLFLSGATECEIDKQGRVLLPVGLRNFARLKHDVVVIGVGKRVEVWAAEEWQQFCAEAEQSFEQIAENIVDIPL